MTHICRFCSHPLKYTFCDLGKTPPSNSYLKNPNQKESFFPLHAFVCDQCFLVQLGQFQTPDEIFSDYAYFSSFSESWIEHGRKYTQSVIDRFQLKSDSFVIEVASNDGYLLQHFKNKKIPILGIEPAKNVAQAAIEKGIPTVVRFFGKATAEQLASENKQADLMIGNNVLAHVPDLNDFVKGFKILLKKTGVITFEFPHLLELIRHNQFDTIYHEHFSYFSLITVEQIFGRHGLTLFDVEEIPTHGGSLRVYLQHENGPHATTGRVSELRAKETSSGLCKTQTYADYANRVIEYKKSLIEWMKELKRANKKIAAYGAPAKGNTLLNYCGITTELLPFTVDKSPHKQGHFLPGTHIPIFAPEKIDEFKPDFLLVLPWNLKDEIVSQMAHIRNWGGKFLIPIPQLTIL